MTINTASEQWGPNKQHSQFFLESEFSVTDMPPSGDTTALDATQNLYGET